MKMVLRYWIPLVAIVVTTVGGFTVSRVHGLFGSQVRESYSDGKSDDTKPFNPKQLVYEVFGPAGTIADINYFDINSEPQQVEDVELPWSIRLTTTLPAVTGNIVAQGTSQSIGCRIIVDGAVKDQRIGNDVNAYTFCLVKSA